MLPDRSDHYAAIRREFFERRAQRYFWLVSVVSAALATWLFFSLAIGYLRNLSNTQSLPCPC